MRASTILILFLILTAATAEAEPTRAAGDAATLGAIDERPPGEDDALHRCGKVTGPIAVTFKPGIELGELVAWAMSFTCKNFVYSSRVVAGRSLLVTIVAPSKMTAAQAWRLFLVALHSTGLTVVSRGEALEIVETPQAKRHAIPLARPGATAPAGEQVVRVLLRPLRVPVEDLAAALAPLASVDGELVPLARAGLLVVTDTGAHVARMREMADEIDQGGPERAIYTLPVAHARATDLAPLLRELTASEAPRPGPPRAGKDGEPPTVGDPIRVLVDERTNTLVLHATRAAFQQVRALVERLDLDTTIAATGRAHLVALRHGDAVKMAETLNGTLRGGASASAAPRTQPPGRGEPAGEVVGDVRVTADALSNSLLVWASTRDFLAVQEIIRQLDAPRTQVFIEAMIVEVSAATSRDVGVAWHGGRPGRKGDLWFGGQASDGLNTASLASAARSGGLKWSGFLGGVMGAPLPAAASFLGTTIPTYGVLIQALARNDLVEILQSPTLMTTDNIKATLAVGQNVAYRSGVGGVTATPGVALENIQREKVGLTLDVTPHVSAGGSEVRLDIDIALQDLIGADELGPTWSERKVTNTVVVGDGHTVVIGGLVGRKQGRVSTRIPLLGDLPLLGHLFRSSHSEDRKTSLMVLLTPHLLTDALDRARAVDRILQRRSEVLGSLDRLDRMRFQARPDGRRMRGLVSEIDRTLREVEQQRAQLDDLGLGPEVPAGPLESTAEAP